MNFKEFGTCEEDMSDGKWSLAGVADGLRGFVKEIKWRRYALLLTFIIYTCFHASRKPLSVVKSVLHANCTNLTPPANVNSTVDPNWCSWKPFDLQKVFFLNFGEDTNEANSLFGLLDSAFLFSYAISMFFSGFIGERMNLRYFLTIGTLMSGICIYIFGLAKIYNIHNIWYFIGVQFFGGIFQTTGWPGVVTVVGNWYGREKNGLIFGLWNSHTSVGNILGTVVAGMYVEQDWSKSFTVLAIVMMVLSIVIFLFLLSEPSSIRSSSTSNIIDSDIQSEVAVQNEVIFVLENRARVEQRPILSQEPSVKAIGFIEALKIPGVAEFSLSLFFAKLVSYTFLYWLPFYIHSSTTFSPEFSAEISTLFDIGGIAGGIIAGAVSDYTGMQAFTCGAMLLYSVPMLYIYYIYGGTCLSVNILLLLLCGALVNGPYALITTAVSAKLGMHRTLSENTKALSTVTAIIDGTGSIGAASGPLFAGFVSDYFGWEYVFFMLMISDIFAFCMLLRLMKFEFRNFSRSTPEWNS
ncbi:hypothetical protein PGB90_008804 [Kerria lacca]